MPAYNQPLPLEKISLQIFVKCVVDICIRLLNSGRASASEKDALAVCQRLRRRIQGTITCSLANIVTSETLNYLDSRYQYIQDSNSSSCKNVLQHFLKAIIHPQVTRLDITSNWKYISNIVLIELEALPELEILRFCVRDKLIYDSFKHLIPKCLNSLMNLTHLTLPVYCTDEIINMLIKSSPGIAHLDVSESKGVTNMSTDRILKFSYLRSLNISKTGITPMGVKCLVARSEKRLDQVVGLGLSIFNYAQVMSLPDYFRGLRRVILNVEAPLKQDPYDSLKSLKNLEEFIVSGLTSISVPYLPTLKVLGLDVNYVNVKDLSKNCPRLEKLMIKAIHLECSKLTEPFNHLCRLSISSVKLYSIKTLLSATQNVVTLKLITRLKYYKETSFATVFSESLHLLENLFLCPLSGYIHPRTVSLITSNCSTMTNCFVFAFNKKPEDLEKLYGDCIGVQIKPFKCCMMHSHNFGR